MNAKLFALLCAATLPLAACGGGTSMTTTDAASQPADLSAIVGDLATNADLASRADMAAHVDMASHTDMASHVDMAMKHVDMASHDLAMFQVVEMCAEGDYVDGRTDSTKRVVTPWDTSLGKLCIHISSGQSVTWNGVPNASHPLEPHDAASTAGNPITNVSVNTFPNAGKFGYDCEVHHTLMHGAIWVDP